MANESGSGAHSCDVYPYDNELLQNFSSPIPANNITSSFWGYCVHPGWGSDLPYSGLQIYFDYVGGGGYSWFVTFASYNTWTFFNCTGTLKDHAGSHQIYQFYFFDGGGNYVYLDDVSLLNGPVSVSVTPIMWNPWPILPLLGVIIVGVSYYHMQRKKGRKGKGGR